MSSLPISWAMASLPELISPGGIFVDGDWIESKDQDPDGDVRLIQLADVGDGRYVNKSNRFLTHAKAVELGCTFLKRGDVLIARMPDPLGRACIFPGDRRLAVTVVDVCVVRGRQEHFDHAWRAAGPHTRRARGSGLIEEAPCAQEESCRMTKRLAEHIDESNGPHRLCSDLKEHHDA